MSSSDMMGARGSHSEQYPPGHYDYAPRGTWAQVVAILAGTMLGMAAGFEILQGIATIARDGLYASGVDYAYKLNTDAWGWTHVVMGLLLLAVAIGLLLQKSWAQVTGLFVAGLSTLTNFAFLPYYPAWSLTIIGINILIICALCALLRMPDSDAAPQ